MKAMVLCAGFGTRLGDLTQELPKPMLLLQNRPLLEYILCNLRRSGFSEVAVNLHFMPEAIQEYFGDGARWGLKLSYSYEPRLLGTAGGVKKMEDFFDGEESFLVHYGDIITDQDFAAMLRFHRERQALLTMLVHERSRSNSVVVLDKEQRVIDFLERPTEESRRGVHSKWVYSGVCMCGPAVLERIPVEVACDLPRDIFPDLIGTRRVFGFPLSGHRSAIDSQARYYETQTAIAENRVRFALPSERSPRA